LTEEIREDWRESKEERGAEERRKRDYKEIKSEERRRNFVMTR